jgi:DNA-binding response OmpR family regulator
MSAAQVKLKILVIDDQKEVAATMAILLRRVGFEVSIVHSGIEGINLARQEKFDLIATDIDLPDMNGFEICAQLKKDFRFLRTPIVLISGRSSRENRHRALESGAADFISKPFDSFIFVSRILTLIRPAKD